MGRLPRDSEGPDPVHRRLVLHVVVPATRRPSWLLSSVRIWAFLTLGCVEYPGDSFADGNSNSNASSASCAQRTPSSASSLHAGPNTVDALGFEHVYASFAKEAKHTCAYCGTRMVKYCVSYERAGRGIIPVCGRKSGRACCDSHAINADIKHASWVIAKQAS